MCGIAQIAFCVATKIILSKLQRKMAWKFDSRNRLKNMPPRGTTVYILKK